MNKKLEEIILVILIGFLIFNKKIMDTWDTFTNNRIKKLHPKIRKDVAEFINTTEKLYGVSLRISDGLRTFEEQDKLYNQGRTTSGNIVTNAKAGKSWHNYGLAFDVVVGSMAKPFKDNEYFDEICELATTYGFQNGYKMWRWDAPHFQINFGMSINDAYNLYMDGTLKDGYIWI